MSHHYIRFTNVSYRYPNGHEALHDVSFLITHGQKVALLGLNGAGKSTLMQHVNGLLLPTSGEVNVGDVPVTKKTLKLVRRAVGMVFQNPDDQLFMPTVEEDVAFGPLNMGLPREEVERRVAVALEVTGASDLRKRAPYELSGGQKRRVAIATVLSMEPDILVMDEPTSDLDIKGRQSFIDMVQAFSHTILLATHDLDLARTLCPTAILLDKGTIIAQGPTEEVIGKLKRV